MFHGHPEKLGVPLVGKRCYGALCLIKTSFIITRQKQHFQESLGVHCSRFYWKALEILKTAQASLD